MSAASQDNLDLLAKIRTVPDFPKPGILFYDLTTLLQDANAFRTLVDRLLAQWQDIEIDCVVGVDARGFILGGALAYHLNAGLVLVRKQGKLPYKTESVSYDLEYGQATLEVHVDAFSEGARVLVVDDLLATGGTAAATRQLVEASGAAIVGFAFVMELDALAGRDRLAGANVRSLIHV